MLLVLKPLAFVFLSVRESIDTIALALSLHILTIVCVTVLIDCMTLAVRLSSHHLALVLSSVSCRARSQRYFLRPHTHWNKPEND